MISLSSSTVAGLVLTLYALTVMGCAAELARVWFAVNRAGRRCSREARTLARAGVALVVFLSGPVVLGLTPTLFGLPVVGTIWYIIRHARVHGIVLRSSLSHPRHPKPGAAKP